MITPIIPYLGNKFDMLSWIYPNIPEHNRWVDVFCGSATVTLNKPQSKLEVINDRNKLVANFFEVIRNNLDDFLYELQISVSSEVLTNKY